MSKTYTPTSKGFKVIPMTMEEIQKFGTVAPICDRCCDPLFKGGIFIPVLANRVYCESCYNDWHASAINYPEDRDYETRATERALKVLNS